MPVELPDADRLPSADPPADGSAIDLRDIFADLRQESGAFIIAAAGFAEYALERDDLRNGVFTASVIQALRADPGLDGNRARRGGGATGPGPDRRPAAADGAPGKPG